MTYEYARLLLVFVIVAAMAGFAIAVNWELDDLELRVHRLELIVVRSLSTPFVPQREGE